MSTVVAMGDTLGELTLQVSDAWHRSPDIAASACLMGVGGSAANFCAVSAALGLHSVLVSEMGDDVLTDFLASDLSRHGVDTSLMRSRKGANSLCVITVGDDGDRRFLSYRGRDDSDSNYDKAGYLERLIARVRTADWLHISGFWLQRETTADLVLAAVSAAQESHLPISLDPSPLIMDDPNESLWKVLKAARVVFPNAYEACALTKAADSATAARALSSLGIPIVVVTDGASGSLLVTESGMDEVHAPAIRALDTTGAGDALAAGFVAAYLNGHDPREALIQGTDAATVAVSMIGGHTAADEIRRLRGVSAWTHQREPDPENLTQTQSRPQHSSNGEDDHADQ
jgi:sugar/nucleoside kinase (ribokinase family)